MELIYIYMYVTVRIKPWIVYATLQPCHHPLTNGFFCSFSHRAGHRAGDPVSRGCAPSASRLEGFFWRIPVGVNGMLMGH